jgi:hypothetical protein
MILQFYNFFSCQMCYALCEGRRIKQLHVLFLNRWNPVGLRNGETRSYSNIISRAESNGSSNAPKTNDLGKKGKKPSRVLLSTAGGRRY